MSTELLKRFAEMEVSAFVFSLFFVHGTTRQQEHLTHCTLYLDFMRRENRVNSINLGAQASAEGGLQTLGAQAIRHEDLQHYQRIQLLVKDIVELLGACYPPSGHWLLPISQPGKALFCQHSAVGIFQQLGDFLADDAWPVSSSWEHCSRLPFTSCNSAPSKWSFSCQNLIHDKKPNRLHPARADKLSIFINMNKYWDLQYL